MGSAAGGLVACRVDRHAGGSTVYRRVGTGRSIYGAASAPSNTLIGAVDGDLNFGQVLLNAGESGVVSGLTAGLDQGIFGAGIGPDGNPLPSDTFGGVLGQGGGGFGAITGTTVLNTAEETALNTAIGASASSLFNGTDFSQNLLSSLRSNAANLIVLPLMMNEAGGLASDLLSKTLLHAVAGAASGAIVNGAQGAEGGALGAALGALTSAYDNGLSTNDQLGLAQLIGGLGSLIVGDSSLSGAAAAVAGVLYNDNGAHRPPALAQPQTGSPAAAADNATASANGYETYGHYCAGWVISALRSAGYDVDYSDARYAGPNLVAAGFAQVSQETSASGDMLPSGYTPQKGDIVVETSTDNQHMAIFNGTQWVSDTLQAHVIPYTSKHPVTATFYRHP